jgi:hypothetical protein
MNTVTLSGLGQPAVTDRMTVTVKSFREDAGNKYYRPQSGYTYLFIELKIVNTGRDMIDTSPQWSGNGANHIQFMVENQAGCRFGEDRDVGMRSTLERGILLPGEEASGQIAFQVPAGWKNLTFDAVFNTPRGLEETLARVRISRRQPSG